MGYGEYIGGGSVHWRVVHEEYEVPLPARRSRSKTKAGQPVPPPQERRTERARLRTADVPPNVPAEHVANLDVLDFEARGKDTIVLREIGRCCGSKDHEGHFRVQLRFPKLQQAKKALAAAALSIRREGDQFVVTLDVPVVERTDEQVGPPAKPPAEVRVDW